MPQSMRCLSNLQREGAIGPLLNTVADEKTTLEINYDLSRTL